MSIVQGGQQSGIQILLQVSIGNGKAYNMTGDQKWPPMVPSTQAGILSFPMFGSM